MDVKLLIAGSRTFSDYDLLSLYVTSILSRIKSDIPTVSREEFEIVAGGAKGADELAITFAKRKGYRYREFPADWESYGNQAGMIRNKEMAEYIYSSFRRFTDNTPFQYDEKDLGHRPYVLCFWDGKSRGTKNMIHLSLYYEFNLFVVLFGEEIRLLEINELKKMVYPKTLTD